MPQPSSTEGAPARTALRVLKKLAPTDRGAIKLARKYGEHLICVRYRTDAAGSYRYTTVELLVDTVPIVRRPLAMVHVRIGPTEHSLQAKVRSEGARWDPRLKLWRMPLRSARALKLDERIVGQM
jgi:hypothetical protein